MRIRIKTLLSPSRCAEIVEKDRLKDIKDAEKIMKVLDGKAGELGMIQRRVAGNILHSMLKLMGETKLELIKDEFKERAKHGTMQFVSCHDGELIVNVPDEVIMGAKMRGREEAGLKQLKKQFHASSVEFLEEKKNGE